MEFCQLSAGVADSCNAATWFQTGAVAGACVRKARFFPGQGVRKRGGM